MTFWQLWLTAFVYFPGHGYSLLLIELELGSKFYEADDLMLINKTTPMTEFAVRGFEYRHLPPT